MRNPRARRTAALAASEIAAGAAAFLLAGPVRTRLGARGPFHVRADGRGPGTCHGKRDKRVIYAMRALQTLLPMVAYAL
jgi:hypothetical protein